MMIARTRNRGRFPAHIVDPLAQGNCLTHPLRVRLTRTIQPEDLIHASLQSFGSNVDGMKTPFSTVLSC
jgi:hypothetical protein